MINPRSLANLQPQRNGEPSRNPSGRPKTIGLIRDLIRQDIENRRNLDELMDRLYQEDLKTYLAYAFGKPVDNLSFNDGEGNPLMAIIERARQRLHLNGC